MNITLCDMISRAPHRTQLKQSVWGSLTIILNHCDSQSAQIKSVCLQQTTLRENKVYYYGEVWDESFKYGDHHEHCLTVSPERHSWWYTCKVTVVGWGMKKTASERSLPCLLSHLPHNLWMKGAVLSDYWFGKVTKSPVSKRCEGRRFQTLFNKPTST